MNKKYDYLIVGSGLYGSVLAYELTKKNKRVLVLEKRNHIGGNIYTENIKEKLAVCVDNMQGKAESAFVTLIDSVIAQNAIPQSNAVYLAPYVVDAKYNDCINTISADLYGILAQNGYAPVKGNSSISQNSGSRTLIPALIRHCRSQNIPYVVLGAIEDINKAPSASLKIIDVKSGAILFNQHKKLN